MLGGSPIKVAHPCKLLDMAIAIIMLVGLIFSFLAKDKAIGATIKTVATFSTNAEIKPESAQIKSIDQAVFLALSTIISAIYAGTRLSIKISATTNVPTNIPITFQLMAKNASLGLITPNKTKSRAPITAMGVLFLGKKTKRIYALIKIKSAVVLFSIKVIIFLT